MATLQGRTVQGGDGLLSDGTTLVDGSPSPEWRDAIYYRYYEYPHGWHLVRPHYGVRTERYKLIVTPEGQEENRSAAAYLHQRNAHFISDG